MTGPTGPTGDRAAPATGRSGPSGSGARIARRFAERKAAARAALVPYVTSGFPDPATTLPLLHALEDAGADVLELGVPFSDPLADGPTIQRSSWAALQKGTTVRSTLDTLRRFRERSDTPVVLFTYLNPVMRYGTGRFCRDAAEAGADGLLLTDLPAGADPEVEDAVGEAGLDLIRLLAPTTPKARMPEVAAGGRGFLYYISRTGVTGARRELRAELGREVRSLREVTDLPIAVGFGISTPEQAGAVAAVADGVVVGSALIQELEEGGIDAAAEFVGGLRAGMDAGR